MICGSIKSFLPSLTILTKLPIVRILGLGIPKSIQRCAYFDVDLYIMKGLNNDNAILNGTPTLSGGIAGSPTITALAEKSIDLPSKLLRCIPVLPFIISLSI